MQQKLEELIRNGGFAKVMSKLTNKSQIREYPKTPDDVVAINNDMKPHLNEIFTRLDACNTHQQIIKCLDPRFEYHTVDKLIDILSVILEAFQRNTWRIIYYRRIRTYIMARISVTLTRKHDGSFGACAWQWEAKDQGLVNRQTILKDRPITLEYQSGAVTFDQWYLKPLVPFDRQDVNLINGDSLDITRNIVTDNHKITFVETSKEIIIKNLLESDIIVLSLMVASPALIRRVMIWYLPIESYCQ